MILCNFQNPVEGIKTISDFLHLDHDVTFCRQVAEKASFGAMQDREQQVLSTLSKGAHDGFIRKGDPVMSYIKFLLMYVVTLVTEILYLISNH